MSGHQIKPRTSEPPPQPEKAKRKRLRPVSKQRAKLMREVDEDRKAFREQFPRCCVCGVKHPEEHTIHEIVRGGNRKDALKHRETWLPACYRCNCGPLNSMPIEQQAAIKLILDADYFDLHVINELRGRAQTAITLADVARWLRVSRYWNVSEGNYRIGGLVLI